MTISPRLNAAPHLTLGAHLSADEGACLMEVVSQHAREPWSDAPRCTHPLLAHVARLVNDAMSDTGRQSLLELAPTLVTASPENPATYPRIALACTSVAMEHHATLFLAHLNRAAFAELKRETIAHANHRTGGITQRTRRQLYQQGPATHAAEEAVRATCTLPQPGRDEVLRQLLNAAVDAAELSST